MPWRGSSFHSLSPEWRAHSTRIGPLRDDGCATLTSSPARLSAWRTQLALSWITARGGMRRGRLERRLLELDGAEDGGARVLAERTLEEDRAAAVAAKGRREEQHRRRRLVRRGGRGAGGRGGAGTVDGDPPLAFAVGGGHDAATWSAARWTCAAAEAPGAGGRRRAEGKQRTVRRGVSCTGRGASRVLTLDAARETPPRYNQSARPRASTASDAHEPARRYGRVAMSTSNDDEAVFDEAPADPSCWTDCS